MGVNLPRESARLIAGRRTRRRVLGAAAQTGTIGARDAELYARSHRETRRDETRRVSLPARRVRKAEDGAGEPGMSPKAEPAARSAGGGAVQRRRA
jgi:hypothetical protein